VTRLLVTGSEGQLGRAVLATASARGWAAQGRDVDTLDITDSAAVFNWVERVGPDVVVNCAAFTEVDACEDHEERAMLVNGVAVGHLAEACNRVGAMLVQVSTDYVFLGAEASPLQEDDALEPVNAYGRTKLAGELAAAHAAHHLIARTAWLYGEGGRNFVEAIRRQIDGGAESLRVVADQTGCPTYCDDLAAALLDLVDGGARGVVHAVNAGSTTWYGFACEIARHVGSDIAVHPVTTADFPRPAQRPTHSVLDITRLEELLGRDMPSWQDALGRYLERT